MSKADQLAQQACDTVYLIQKRTGASILDVATQAALNYHHERTPLNKAIMDRADELAGSLAECLEVQGLQAQAEAEELAWRTRW